MLNLSTKLNNKLEKLDLVKHESSQIFESVEGSTKTNPILNQIAKNIVESTNGYPFLFDPSKKTSVLRFKNIVPSGSQPNLQEDVVIAGRAGKRATQVLSSGDFYTVTVDKKLDLPVLEFELITSQKESFKIRLEDVM